MRTMESIIKCDKMIKEEYKSENGKILALSNICVPGFVKGYEAFDAFYSRVAENFVTFIRSRLVKRAEKESQKEGFVPFSGVLKYKNTFENDSYVSVILDSYKFDGKRRSVTVRLSQVWSKEEKRLVCFGDLYSKPDKSRLKAFFTSEAERELNEGRSEFKRDFQSFIRNKTDFSRFYLVKDGVAFYFEPGEIHDGDFPEVFIDKRKI